MLLRKRLTVNYSAYLGITNQFRLNHKWQEPGGHDTGIKVRNVQEKRLVPLKFPNKDCVKWYICGPTVYDSSHVGHASTYVRFDIIRRALEDYFNIVPIVALGITDVAEKVYEKAKKTGKTWKSVAIRYETEFFSEMNRLNVIPPNFTLRVSEHIPQIIEFVEKLLQKEMAYKTESGCIYFDVRRDVNYGRFKPLPEKIEGTLFDGKRYPLDFVLWRSRKEEEFLWNSPWGTGIPGWHIECSAMASHVFGSDLDIHSGGADLIYPHHENEETQSCCYHGRQQWANYWLHAGLLQAGEEKMSKSLENFITIEDFLKTYQSDHLRIFCFMSHYRKALFYSSETMQLAVGTYEKISSFLQSSELYLKGSLTSGDVNEDELFKLLERTKEDVRICLTDDFNTNGCITTLIKLITKAGKMIHAENKEITTGRSIAAVAAVDNYVRKFLKSFGFTLGESGAKTENTINLDRIIETTLNFRAEVRAIALHVKEIDRTKRELLQLCDNLRSNFKDFGVNLRDSKDQALKYTGKEKMKQ